MRSELYKNIPDPVIKKFWASIAYEPEDCWTWTGKQYTSKTPSPVIRSQEDEYSARRVSVTLDGSTPQPYDVVRPTCGNHLCVNPKHLMFKDEDRFWSDVYKLSDKHGACWVWMGHQDSNMYGRFSYGRRNNVLAHRYSWFLFSGHMPPACVRVCHKCDHPYCVNPAHLFIGTQKDNMLDMVSKGRGAKGTMLPITKLTEEKVIEIRRLYKAGGITQRELSAMFGVTKACIKAVVQRQNWKHLP